jgi:sigma-E factor negative regulatory protein RseB
MRRRAPLALRLCLGGLIMLSGGATGAEATAASGRAWLEAMAAALRANAYEGVLSYARDDAVTELRLVHGHQGSAIYERLSRLDGAPKEMLRRGDEFFLLGQEDEALPPAAVPRVQHPVTNFADVPETYQVQLGTPVRVGGRRAQHILVDPQDATRFAYQLWLDEETALPLRMTMNYHQGAPVEVVQFRALAVGEEPPEAAFALAGQPVHQHPVAPAQAALAHGSEGVALEALSWRIAWVPPGFQLLAEVADQPVMLRLGDGLATVTVFIDAEVEDEPLAVQHGPTAAVVRHLRHCDGRPHQVTVIGEVPVGSAERIAQSLHCADPPS